MSYLPDETRSLLSKVTYEALADLALEDIYISNEMLNDVVLLEAGSLSETDFLGRAMERVAG